jgi:hypothetical protein
MRGLFVLAVSGLLLAPCVLAAQDEGGDESSFFDEGVNLEISTEIKTHLRWSEKDRVPLATPFPPEFVPVGQENVALATVAPGTSLEVSKATVFFDVDMPHQISARVKVDFIDLYDRNPTSTDKKLDVDEAWIAFGDRQQSLQAIAGTSFYALIGKAPKFERQVNRRIETYGLVSTAFNRFPDLQIQIGGSIGTNVYFFGQMSDGNPIFMRDPNALAGDNGTAPPPNPVFELNSGFPIFYHAEVEDLQIDNEFEYGGGAGFRWLSEDQESGIDVLGFYYQYTLPEETPLNGTLYQGDLELLAGAGIPPNQFDGDKRTEWGGNLDLRFEGLGVFAQFVKEESASLPRKGFEVEAGYRIALGDLGDPSALFPAIEPVIRYSRLDNDWTAPREFITQSALWDWQKWDLALRVTIVPSLDLLLEYTINDTSTGSNVDGTILQPQQPESDWEDESPAPAPVEFGPGRKVKNDEFLATLRLRL